MKYLQRRVHDHDVKALVCAQDNIYSGGVDGYLGLSSASKTQLKIVKYGPFLQVSFLLSSSSSFFIYTIELF